MTKYKSDCYNYIVRKDSRNKYHLHMIRMKKAPSNISKNSIRNVTQIGYNITSLDVYDIYYDDFKLLLKMISDNKTIRYINFDFSFGIMSSYHDHILSEFVNKNIVIRSITEGGFYKGTIKNKSDNRKRSNIILLLLIIKCRLHGYNKLVADKIIKYIYPSLLFY
jgi:hypothetical protein